MAWCEQRPRNPINKGEQLLLGLHETAGTPIQIKHATLEMSAFTPVHLADKTITKKLHELRLFQNIGVLPSDLVPPTHYIKSSFQDHGQHVHHNYFFGVSFAQNGFRHYIKTTGKACGMSINLAHDRQETFQEIEVINGICLYGNEHFLLRTQAGNVLSLTARNLSIQEPICDIWVDDHFSLYEVEAIIGLSSFINELVAHTRNIRTIHVEIPRGQYYLFLAEAYQQNLLSPELFQRCMAAIDTRHERIFQAYRKRLKVANIQRISSLSTVENYFCERVSRRQPICFRTVQELLGRDPTWQKILAISPITRWKELSYLSHTVPFLGVGKKQPHKAVLQVDDPIEEKIRINAARIINQLGDRSNYRIWGIYPLQRVVLNPETHPDSDLYHCPHIPLSVSMIKKVMAQTRFATVA